MKERRLTPVRLPAAPVEVVSSMSEVKSLGSSAGEKRAAEDPPADCGHDDSVDENGELDAEEDVSMDCASVKEYCDARDLWMVACRQPEEEDVEDVDSSVALEQDSCEAQYWDDRTGKPSNAEKVRAARAEELPELDRRVWEEVRRFPSFLNSVSRQAIR